MFRYRQAGKCVNPSALHASYCLVRSKYSPGRVAAEGLEMARVARAAGYGLLILTVQKHGKFGKVWVLCGILRHLSRTNLVYYEDTASLVDELKTSSEGDKVSVVHVQSPGYEDEVSKHADRVVSQVQYQREVLVP